MKNAKPGICIITQSHLCRNPRVLKEATTLAQNGYTVDLLTSVYSDELLQQDKRLIQHTDVNLHIIADNSARNLASIINRAVNKAGKLAVRHLGSQTPLALGHAYKEYLKKSKALAASLYICHQEMAACIGVDLIKEGHKVAFDLEDWYSEDLLPEAQADRPTKLLKQAEKAALNKGAYTVTTSYALANALHQRYGGNKPEVIYNVFPSPKLPTSRDPSSAPVKLFWFSQTIGPGRGLEGFISIISGFKTGLEFNLLGSISAAYQEVLTLLISPQHKIIFHPLVHENELMATIAGFDVGLALERTYPLSRNYTITNKFFQYIQAGLPVIATETAGQLEAFKQFSPGFMLSNQPSMADVSALEAWLKDPYAIAAAAEKAKEASKIYNWENESIKLLKLVADVLK